MTILVVDDEPTMAQLMQALLETEGHAALVAGSTEEAEKIIDSTPVDGIALDMRMPGRTGLQWLESLVLTRPELAQRTMIVTGAPLNMEECRRMRSCGATLLFKPFEPRRFLEILRKSFGAGSDPVQSDMRG